MTLRELEGLPTLKSIEGAPRLLPSSSWLMELTLGVGALAFFSAIGDTVAVAEERTGGGADECPVGIGILLAGEGSACFDRGFLSLLGILWVE